MRTLFLLLGELVEAVVKHLQTDPEALKLVEDAADYILTKLGYPDVIPGEPGDFPIPPASMPSEGGFQMGGMK